MNDQYFTPEVKEALKVASEAFAQAFAEAMSTVAETYSENLGFHEHSVTQHYENGGEMTITVSHVRGFDDEEFG